MKFTFFGDDEEHNMYKIIEIGKPTTTTTSATTHGLSLTTFVIFCTKVSWKRAIKSFFLSSSNTKSDGSMQIRFRS